MNRTISDDQIERLKYCLLNDYHDTTQEAMDILDSLAPAQSETESEAVKEFEKEYAYLIANKGKTREELSEYFSTEEIAILGLYNAFLARVPVEKPDVCEWVQEEFESEHWSGSCGIEWVTIEDTPENNGMNFCPNCGKPLKQIEKKLDMEEDDDSSN